MAEQKHPHNAPGTAQITLPPNGPKHSSNPMSKLPRINGPGLLVLQWLTYAFWGWFLLALSVLTALTLTSLIDTDSQSHEGVPYALAAVIVLFPLAFVCDVLYRRNEPAKKIGGAMAIMIVHAVIFAIFAISSLLIGLFTLIGTLLNAATDEQVPGMIALVAACLLATLYYALTFARTLNPTFVRPFVRFYKYAMLGIVIVTVILSVIGPVAKSFTGRNDELIERNLNAVERAVDDYARDNDRLPNSLRDIDVTTAGGRQLVGSRLVEYKNDGTSEGRFGLSTHRYQLCVTYGSSKTTGLYGTTRPDDDGYSSFVTTSNHPAGRTCYKLQISSYDPS